MEYQNVALPVETQHAGRKRMTLRAGVMADSFSLPQDTSRTRIERRLVAVLKKFRFVRW
jgi:hypothetical protein